MSRAEVIAFKDLIQASSLYEVDRTPTGVITLDSSIESLTVKVGERDRIVIPKEQVHAFAEGSPRLRMLQQMLRWRQELLVTARGLVAVGPADTKYRSVGANKFQNPILIVHRDGVEVRANGAVVRDVPVSNVRHLLVRLPKEAWPHGRIVGLQEVGIRTETAGEDAAIRANLKAVEETLGALKIEINRWPS